jgi:CubicO group peptidase (beta-lactamase class C family)
MIHFPGCRDYSNSLPGRRNCQCNGGRPADKIAAMTYAPIWGGRTRAVLAGFMYLCLLAVPSFAVADDIDRYLRTEMARQHIPGMAIAIVRDGKPTVVRTYGSANLELGAPVTRDTVFRIASLSKQMLATGMLLLEREGRVALDEPIAKYLPDAPAAWRGITIRQVLSHTAGLATESPGFDSFRSQSDIERIRAAYAVPLQSAPGEKFSYSNLGYTIVAEIIRQASGEHWPQFMQRRLFGPLGMQATRTASLIDLVPNRASGYQFRDGVQKNVEPLLALRPSGAFLSSLADLIRWDAALRAEGTVISPLREAAWTAARLSDQSPTHYGLGWWIDEVNGHRRVRHGGTQPGFRAEYAQFLDDGLSVIVLANGESVRPNDIALELANRYVPGLLPPRHAVVLEPEVLRPLAGEYRAGPSTILTIGVDGPGLSIQSSDGGAQFHLTAETPTVFFLSKDESYVFTRDGERVTQLEVRAGTATAPGASQLVAPRLP